MADDLGEKTEQPTGKRLYDARVQGQVVRSLDLSASIDLIGAVVLVAVMGGWFVEHCGAMLRQALSDQMPGAGLTPSGFAAMGRWAMVHLAWLVGPALAFMALIAFLAQVMQVGWTITTQPLGPNFSRLNPIQGFGRLFSARSVVKTAVAALKLSLIVMLVVSVVSDAAVELVALPALSAVGGYAHLGHLVMRLCAWMLMALLLIGVADWFYQRWQHRRDLRMTKQQIIEERKSSEGDEQLKARRLKLGRQMVMQRLRMDVPKADVVVTNPTHFSVAIRYDEATMSAPRVVAKGVDFLAFRIREIASVAGVPIVEKPELARALYAHVAVGQEIRPEHYEAMAEVLAYVYRLESQAA